MKNRFRYLGRGQIRIWYERGKHLIESMAQYVGKTLPRNCWYFRWELFFWILFLTFPAIIFSNFNSNCSNLLHIRNLQEQVKKAFCYQKTFFLISGFPIWVSLLGIIFFEVIDRDEDGILEFSEISNYYKGLVGVKDEDLYVVAKEGYRALTAVRKMFFFPWINGLLIRWFHEFGIFFTKFAACFDLFDFCLRFKIYKENTWNCRKSQNSPVKNK